MSKYILYKEVWEALKVQRNELFDGIPRDFDGDIGKDEALAVIARFSRRYQFIDNAIRGSLGSAHTSGSVYMFVTICPPQSVDMLQRLKKVCERYLRRSIVSKYALVYEQRKDRFEMLQGAQGVHAHFLIKTTSTYDSVKRGIRNLIGEWVFRVDCKKEAWVAGKIDYLRGKKDSPDKLRMCAADRDFRRHHGLDDIYYTGEWPGLKEQAPDPRRGSSNGVSGGPHGLLERPVEGDIRSEDGGVMDEIPENPNPFPDLGEF